MVPTRQRAAESLNGTVGVLHLRRVRQGLARVPGWAWLVVASLIVAPIYLRYFGWVAGTCIEFLAPSR